MGDREPELPGKQPCPKQLGSVGHALSFESMDMSFVKHYVWMLSSIKQAQPVRCCQPDLVFGTLVDHSAVVIPHLIALTG